VVGRVQEAAARPAPSDHAVFGDVLRDVDQQRQTGGAQVLRVPYDGHATLAAQSCRSGAAVVRESHGGGGS